MSAPTRDPNARKAGQRESSSLVASRSNSVPVCQGGGSYRPPAILEGQVQRPWPRDSASIACLDASCKRPALCSHRCPRCLAVSRTVAVDDDTVNACPHHELILAFNHSSTSTSGPDSLQSIIQTNSPQQDHYDESDCYTQRPALNANGLDPMERFVLEPMITQPYHTVDSYAPFPIASPSTAQTSAITYNYDRTSSVHGISGSDALHLGSDDATVTEYVPCYESSQLRRGK